MKQFTDITVLLDRSGSMASIKEAMETAFNTFVKEHKSVPSTRMTLIQFDDINHEDIVYQGVPVREVEGLRLKPRGNTPLVDSLCKVIDRTGRRLAGMDKEDRPDQVLMVIITDGQENCSSTYNRQNVFDRITKQRDNYNWQFVYLGANQDAIAEAASFGIRPDWAMNYMSSPRSVTSATASLAMNTVNYTKSVGGARGQSVSSYTTDQRNDALNDDDGA